MKKRYIMPIAELVDMDMLPILTTMSPIVSEEEDDDGRVDSGAGTSNEHVGSWDDIWHAM